MLIWHDKGNYMLPNGFDAVLIGYPNLVGDFGRYELIDQREYFSKFEGGASHLFGLALQNCLTGDLASYSEQCEEIFERYHHLRFEENSVTMQHYHDDRREFHRRIFDIYRYAKSSLACLGENLLFSKVMRVENNERFDTGRFLVK